MLSRFEEILTDLGKQLGVALHPDHRGACRMTLGGSLQIQLEFDDHKGKLQIASFLCEVPPGKFREEVFRTALIHNQLKPFEPILSYSDKNHRLALHLYLRSPAYMGPKLGERFKLFVEQAKAWKEGVARGNVQTLIPHTASSGPRPFGMR